MNTIKRKNKHKSHEREYKEKDYFDIYTKEKCEIRKSIFNNNRDVDCSKIIN